MQNSQEERSVSELPHPGDVLVASSLTTDIVNTLVPPEVVADMNRAGQNPGEYGVRRDKYELIPLRDGAEVRPSAFRREMRETLPHLRRLGRGVLRYVVYAPFVAGGSWRWRAMSAEHYTFSSRAKKVFAGVGGGALKVGLAAGAFYLLKNGWHAPHIELPDWPSLGMPDGQTHPTPSVRSSVHPEAEPTPMHSSVDPDKAVTPGLDIDQPQALKAHRVEVADREWVTGNTADAQKLHISRQGNHMLIDAHRMSSHPTAAVITVDGHAYRLPLEHGRVAVDLNTDLGRALQHHGYDFVEVGRMHGSSLHTVATDIGSGEAGPVHDPSVQHVSVPRTEHLITADLADMGNYKAELKPTGSGNFILQIINSAGAIATDRHGAPVMYRLTPEYFDEHGNIIASLLTLLKQRLARH